MKKPKVDNEAILKLNQELLVVAQAPIDPALPERTKQEQLAGRQRLMDTLRASIVECGLEHLKHRFGAGKVLTAGLRFDGDLKDWIADVTVATEAGILMKLECELEGFPTDRLLAEIALVT